MDETAVSANAAFVCAPSQREEQRGWAGSTIGHVLTAFKQLTSDQILVTMQKKEQMEGRLRQRWVVAHNRVLDQAAEAAEEPWLSNSAVVL